MKFDSDGSPHHQRKTGRSHVFILLFGLIWGFIYLQLLKFWYWMLLDVISAFRRREFTIIHIGWILLLWGVGAFLVFFPIAFVQGVLEFYSR